MSEPRVAIVGAGAVGAALGRRLAASGYALRAVLSRTKPAAALLASQVGAAVASTDLRALPSDVTLLFCCVPDEAIDGVAHELARLDAHDWSACVVAHTSGVRQASALAPLAERGAAVLSFHPMQAFTVRTSPEAFRGICVGLEGDPDAVALGRAVVDRLGARAVTIASEAKARYHLAASLASNAFVTLVSVVHEVLASIDVDEGARQALLRPLIDGTWRNLEQQPPEEALTGPVVRGDRRTVGDHAAAVASHLPHLTPFFVAMTTETVRLAVRSGRLASTEAEELLEVLQATLDAFDDHTLDGL